MNKENLIKKFKITEDEYNELFDNQVKKFKKIFKNKSEDDIKTHAENSMVSALQRKIVSGIKTSEICILGKFPSISFDRIRMIQAKKAAENKKEEQNLSDLKDAQGNPFFNEQDKIIDRWNNEIDEGNPTAKDEHIFWGLDEDKKMFVGRMLGADEIEKIQIGKICKIEHKKSKKTNTIFGIVPRNVADIQMSDKQIKGTDIIDVYNNTAFNLIKDKIKLTETMEDIENAETNAMLAVQGVVFDIADNSFETIVRVLKDESNLDKYINCHIQKPFDNDILKFVTSDSPIKIIGKRGYQRDSEEGIKLDVISMWCDKDYYTENNLEEDVEIKDEDKNKIQDW